MRERPHEDVYEIEGRVFVKKYSPGGISFFMDGNEIGLEKWNRELNKIQPMSILENHSNPLIRAKELHRRKAFVEMINIPKGAVVADIGCEEGQLAALLADKCEKLICLDIDSEVLIRAQSKLSGFSNIDFLTGDARRIPLGDDSLDVCIAAEALEHMPDPVECIRELARVTKPDGKIYISVPNEKLILAVKKTATSLGLSKSLGKLNKGLAVGHVRIFNKSALYSFCEGRIKIEKMKYSFPFFLNIFASGSPIKNKFN